MVESGQQYSTLTGFTYMGNLLVGTGALALPKAFQDAGYALALAVMVFLAFMSYMNATYVVEALSVVCAIQKVKRSATMQSDVEENQNRSPSTVRRRGDGVQVVPDYQDTVVFPTHYFDISEQIELGHAVNTVLGYAGWLFFYVCVILYLFGDLIIYGAVVPKSLMNAVCTYMPDDARANQTPGFVVNLSSNLPCWTASNPTVTRFMIYRILVGVFGLVLGPFVFCGMSQTRYYQYVASFLRWLSFSLMTVWAVGRIAMYGCSRNSVPANWNRGTTLVGTTIYSFMCHHSLPGIVTPMKSKRRIHRYMAVVYMIILAFYLAISVTGMLAFDQVQDVYVLNFFQLRIADVRYVVVGNLLRYFLVLYPVFTISSNYPIIAITLRNNLDSLLFSAHWNSKKDVDISGDGTSSRELLVGDATQYGLMLQRVRSVLRNVLLPLIVLAVPLTIALFTDDVEVLISVTGSYAGVGIQYITPTWIAWSIRSRYPIMYESMPARYASPFKSRLWNGLSLFWALLSIIIVTVNHLTFKH